MLEFLGRFNYNFLLPFLVVSDMLIPLEYFNVAGHVMVVRHLGLVPDSCKQLLQVFSSTDQAYNFLLYQPQGASLVETSGRLVCWNHTTASSALSVEITQQLQGALSVEFQTQPTQGRILCSFPYYISTRTIFNDYKASTFFTMFLGP